VVPVEDRDFRGSIPEGLIAGELWVHGPNVMKCYYRRPEETKAAFVYEDGQRWLKTGDIAYIDNRGYIYIIDRLKELIKVKGLQVAPTEVEQVILEHLGVEDAAVIGANIDGEEYVQAFIVRKPRHESVTEDDIFELIRGQLARHKWPTGGIFFVQAIPRTGSGKVQRKFLPRAEVKVIRSRL
jgi:acyl-CoA synthetase (AMP-forming)/AMP-acid ligase II